ncbi:MAG: PaaI family thioesterase [Desulfobacterales bacterium]
MDEKRIRMLKKDFAQGFPAWCGFEVKEAGDGIFETFLHIRQEHRQQDGFVHAGVMATMADHTAGYSAFTTVSEDFRILTIEFKINFFKPATGDMLICRSKVINRGKTVIVSESEVFSVSGSQEKMVSKATVTLMAVPVSVIKKG